MKRIISVLLIGICIFALLSACVTKEEKDEPEVCTECFPYPIYE